MTDQMDRRAILSLLAGVGVMAARPSAGLAATYPDHPIRVAVPFSAGGAVDIVARTVMDQVSPQLGQPVVIEDRPGANGNIAPAFVARAAPDGYTVLIGANGLATNESLFDNLSFKAMQDFEPIVLVGYSPLILVVQPSFEAKTVKDLVDMAKAAPGKLTYASAGNGTSGHLAAEIFKQVLGIDALHVPYKGGAQALVDIIAGRISFMFVDPVQVMPQIKANQLRAIAVSSAERLALLPDVPTITEAGYPGVEATVWWGFLVPAHTPGDIVMRLNKEINIALGDQKVKDTLLAMGVVIKGGSPDDFKAFLKSETDKWATIIRTANIKAD
ncbi:Bug family tripartite tricarboxylate transporter substrate binding protein [Bradyrhizobium canariense]|uniref:Tripartite-type tricarboxylate transporter, receptor component TctC n=1 Tax=Bradyrhizobium canariense TaxID=255045 RepID=A0A1H1T8J9_9BRAD|nr:tripartite tricarboxylate transporter substrate binding protein [Bradyrhizobium canariense]SDS56600.1 Tripartite-type tricarboxylate transporter, receptor component TctC [Bradyrhizobium canariense]